MRPSEIIHHRGVFFEPIVVIVPDRLLQRNDRLRIVEMIFLVSAAAQTMEADGIQRCVRSESERVKCLIMTPGDIFLNFPHSDAARSALRAGEVFVDDLLRKADGLEDTGGLIRLQCTDSHLCSSFDDAVEECLVIVLDGGVIILVQDADIDQLRDALLCQVRIDRAGTEAEERRHLMDVAGLAALENQGNRRALFRADEVLLDRAHCKKGRDRHMVLVDAAVGEDDDVLAV